ncbi:MAG: TIGR03118 family protein [Alphaproteobacteria bacterium]|nr:TIGR03118 family protein [Alphaproteobacteria bacterium]
MAAGVFAAAPVLADDSDPFDQDNRYVVNKLVSDLSPEPPNPADPVLQNSWGVAFSPAGSPFWIADNDTGCSTLYDGTGEKQKLQVSIPLPGNVIPPNSCKHFDFTITPSPPAPAAPTGIIWNASSAFPVPGTSTTAAFIFDTEDGTVSAWGGGTNAVLAVDNSNNPPTPLNNGAVYKGLAFGVNVNGPFLFATNFRAGTIDVFGQGFKQVAPGTKGELDGNFSDPKIPAGFAPFGIQNINGDLFVTYAKQNAAKHDDVAGLGNGFVDVFDTDGHLLRRFASGGTLDSPWGVARASFAFGKFSGKILVGNFGNGWVNVFDNDGTFVGLLRGTDGKPISIDGLWTLTLGGGAKSSSDTLYFTAGPNGETDGLFGTITPAADSD